MGKGFEATTASGCSEEALGLNAWVPFIVESTTVWYSRWLVASACGGAGAAPSSGLGNPRAESKGWKVLGQGWE